MTFPTPSRQTHKDFLPLRKHLITNGTCRIIAKDLVGIFSAFYTVKKILGK